jgi:hypothetical protein
MDGGQDPARRGRLGKLKHLKLLHFQESPVLPAGLSFYRLIYPTVFVRLPLSSPEPDTHFTLHEERDPMSFIETLLDLIEGTHQ